MQHPAAQRLLPWLALVCAFALATQCSLPGHSHGHEDAADTAAANSADFANGWRRTAQGWEQMEDWLSTATEAEPLANLWLPHPLVFAIMLLATCVAVLAAGAKRRDREGTQAELD